MADVPWSGGPPTPAELENYLVTVRGLEREQARRVAQMYREEGIGQSPRLNRNDLTVWVDNAVTTVTPRGEGPERGDGDFSAVVNQAEAMARDDEEHQRSGEMLAEERSQVLRNQVQSIYDNSQYVGDQGPGFDPAAAAQSLAVGYVTDAGGNPVLGEDGQPLPYTANELWDEVRHMNFNFAGLNMPFTDKVGRFTQREANASARRWSQDRNAVFKGPTRSGMSARSAQASARRYAGQARRLGLGGAGQRARVKGGLPGTRWTPSEALAMLGSMDEAQLTSLQQEMWEAGLYENIELGGEGAMPSWGEPDAATRQALISLFINAAQRGGEGMPLNRILAEMQSERISRMPPPEFGPGAPNAAELVEIEGFKPEVTSAETLSSLIEDVGQDLFGEFVPEDRKQALIAKLQEKEVGLQRQQYLYSVADVRGQAEARYNAGFSQSGQPMGGPGAQDIDRFMAAIGGQESGGNYGAVNASSGAAGKYQIMPSNWSPWATRAGLGPNAPRTPENQEIVAKRIMLDYYQQFGNWRDVAVAWYAGPGAVGGSRGNASQGNYPTINQYADQILDRMGQVGPTNAAGAGGLVEMRGADAPPIPRFDPQAEAEAILKAQDPAGWEAHEFADRAVEYYNLLGGVV